MRAALAIGATGSELEAIVVAHKQAGLSQRQAYDTLQALRAGTDERTEDAILDLMDLVVGWGRGLWPDRLDT